MKRSARLILALVLVFLILGLAVDAQTLTGFIPVTPCRMIDTRKNTGQGYPPPYGTPSFATGERRIFTVDGAIAAGNSCDSVIPAGVAGLAVNITAANPAGPGDIREAPGNVPSPTPLTTSILNFSAVNIANASAIPVSGDQITLGMGGAGTNVLMDVYGYFQGPVLSSVATDATLSGNGTSGTPLGIAASGVGNAQLAPLAVTFDKVGSGAAAVGQALTSDGAGNAGWSTVAGFALPYSGVTSAATPAFFITSNSSNALYGLNGTAGYAAVAGANVGATNPLGIYGVGGAPTGMSYTGAVAMWGDSDAGYGVYGTSNSDIGILGISATNIGVAGVSTSGYGLYANSTTSSAILGQIGAGSGLFHCCAAAVWGDDGGGAFGVLGLSHSIGVYGGSDSGIGVEGNSSSNKGVYGFSTSNAGVYGESSSNAGVYGISHDPIGLSAGVDADCNGIFACTSLRSYGASDLVGDVYNEGNEQIAGNLTIDGSLTTIGTKHFAMPHPTDPSKQIVFTSLEGNESGTYFRGTAHTVNGFATIEVPETFRLATSPNSLSAVATPVGELAVLAVVSQDLHEVVVQSSKDVKFNYIVNGVRAGFEVHQTLADNTAFVPRSAKDRVLAKALDSEAVRRLKASGILNADGTVNLETAHRLGWDQKPGWNDAPAVHKVEAVGDPMAATASH
jgi:hypothetical protein